MLPRHWIAAIAMLAASLPLHAQNNVVGELFASDASVRGAVLLAGTGTKIVSGSSVTAGEVPAVFRLARGGDLRICPATSISLTSSTSGRELMVGMSIGGIEAHYALGSSADTIMTPDFRIMLAGPGTFAFAVRTDEQGNAIIKALKGNAASLIVSELNGDATYQVKPDEEVLFHNGNLGNPEHANFPNVGCPAPPPAPQVAAVEPPKEIVKPAPQQEVAPVMHPVEPHPMEAQVPFIYQAAAPGQEAVVGVARLRLTQGSRIPNQTVLPPPPPPVEKAAVVPHPAEKKPEKHGFFGKVGAFFAAIFR